MIFNYTIRTEKIELCCAKQRSNTNTAQNHTCTKRKSVNETTYITQKRNNMHKTTRIENQMTDAANEQYADMCAQK